MNLIKTYEKTMKTGHSNKEWPVFLVQSIVNDSASIYSPHSGHASGAAAVRLCAWRWAVAVVMLLLPMMGAWAVDPLTPISINSVDFPVEQGKVYKIVSPRATLGVSDDGAFASYVNTPTNSGVGNTNNTTGSKYYFSFIIENDKVYLYSVSKKGFVWIGQENGNGTHRYSYITAGAGDPVYIFNASNSAYPDYKYSLSCSSDFQSLVFNSSTDAENKAWIDNYHEKFDEGNSYQFVEVAGETLSETELAEARKLLQGYTPTTLSAKSLSTSAVYTIKNAAGYTLSANSNNNNYTLTGSNATTINDLEKFAFVTDPSDNTKVYLYNLSKQRFVTNSSSLQTGSGVQPIHLFDTQDANYPVAFGFADTWISPTYANNYGDTRGTSNARLNNTTFSVSNYARPDNTNKFVLTAVEGQTFTSEDARSARRRLKDANDFSLETYYDAGLTLNKQVYTLRTDPTKDGDRGGMYATSTGLRSTRESGQTAIDYSTTDPNQQFVFVTVSDEDTSQVYLYSVAQQKFAKFTGDNSTAVALVDLAGSPTALYVYGTDDYSYNLAFSFKSDTQWGTSDLKNGNTINISGSRLLVRTNYSQLDNGNRWQANAVATFSDADLAKARILLNGYTKSDYAAAGLQTDGQMYTIQSGSGAYLKATANGLASTTDAPAAGDETSQFVFYKDATSGATYLYSVGLERFVTSTGNFGNLQSANALNVFSTLDDGYPVAFGFSDAWASGSVLHINDNSVVSTATVDPTEANRFKATLVGTLDDRQKSHEAIAVKGSYDPTTFAAASITTTSKVYLIKTEAGSDEGSWLTATKEGKFATTTTDPGVGDAYAQWVFYETNGNTYLYNVGVGSVLSSSNTFGVGTAAPIHVYNTGDTDGRSSNLAFGYAGTWTDGNALNADGTTSNAPAAANRFSVTALPDSITYNHQWAADAVAGTYSLSTPKEMGIDTASVYYIYSGSYVVMSINGGKTALDRFSRTSSNVKELTANSGTHFAFLPDKSDPVKVYLYSLDSKTAANVSGNLVTYFSSSPTGTAAPVYIYATHDPDFPIAFSFSGTKWNEEGAVCINATLTSNDVTSDVTPSLQNRYTILPITDESYNIADAQAGLEFHRTGASGRPLTKKGMQQVSVVEYYYYVKPGESDYTGSDNSHASTINLNLPFFNYDKSRDANANGNGYEPQAYIRWYDYNTDAYATTAADGHGQLQKSPFNDNRLKTYYYKGTPVGLFDYNMPGPGPFYTRQGAVYVIPDAAKDADWPGDDIACDVGVYTDYNNLTTKNDNIFACEPTLEVRYVFHIRSYRAIADSMYAQLAEKSGNEEDLTLSDKKVMVFGAKDGNARMNIRTDLQDLKYYWFYPMTSSYAASHHVFNRGDNSDHAITNTGYTKSAEPVQATGVEWRVYNEARDHYRVIGGDLLRSRSTFITIGNNNANDRANNTNHGLRGGSWKDLDGYGSKTSCSIPDNGSVYLVGLLTAINNTDTLKCPFFNVQLDLNNMFYPMTLDSIRSRREEERTIEYLNDRYGSTVGAITLDDDNSSLDLEAPTSDLEMTTIPSRFARRQYGFVYPQLASYRLGNPPGGQIPKHGEYGIFKQNDISGYKLNDVTNLFDKSRFGSFMQIDASQESRLIGYEDFTGSLCSGSQLIISAWVANVTGNLNNDTEQPEVRFNIYGVEKDAEGNDVRTRLLGSVASGNFKSNALAYDQANWEKNKFQWYQIFGIFTLPANSGASSFQDFRVTIDNFCDGTNGADYAVDDIRIWSSNDKVTVIQKLPACAGSNAATFKIKANYTTMRELTENQVRNRPTGVTGRRVFYRFYETDASYTTFTPLAATQTTTVGTTTTTTDIYHNNGKDYGVAVIPDAYSADDWFNKDINIHRFEMNTGGTWDVIIDSIPSLQLDRTKQYFVALAYPQGNDISNWPNTEPAEWGRPTDICSSYSNYFTILPQSLVVTIDDKSVSTVAIDCDKETTTNYNINVDMRVPGQESGGVVTLTDVTFDWIIAHKYDESLRTALKNYRTAYPDATDWSMDKALVEGTYTESDQTILQKNVYSETNPKGILVVNGSDKLTGYPLPMGADSIWAIPTKTEYKQRGVTYLICDEPVVFVVRGVKNGPGLSFGIDGITYPSSETNRSLRLGLPQLRQMGSDGVIRVPINGRQWKQAVSTDENLQFLGSDQATASVDVFISATNDSTIDLSNGADVKLCEVASTDLAYGSTSLDLKNFELSKMHEGYWYQVVFIYKRTNVPEGDNAGSNCTGVSFLTIKVVPEYVTWDPSVANGFNSNWNVDANWRRSTAAELYDPAYTDYRTATYTYPLYETNAQANEGKPARTATNPVSADAEKLTKGTEPKSYVPMYFSKVTLPYLTSRPYPMMPFIQYSADSRLILSMANGKGDQPTANIQYDMMASPVDGREAVEGKTSGVSFRCINFDGDTCQQVYYKAGAQLRNQHYLRYEKAWVELALPVDFWGCFTTPMKWTTSGDMYMPKFSARQTTPAFSDITFDDVDKTVTLDNKNYGYFGAPNQRLYSRMRLPIYQRLWGQGGHEFPEEGDYYNSYDSPTAMLIWPSLESGDDVMKDGDSWSENHAPNVWSHAFNALADNSDFTEAAGVYYAGKGVAGKVGDDFATAGAKTAGGQWHGGLALLRLPKADQTFDFYKWGTTDKGTPGEVKSSRTGVPVDRTDNYRLAVDYDFTQDALGSVSFTTTPLPYETVDGKRQYVVQYDLIGNPYTSAISVDNFISANRNSMLPVSRDGKDVYCIWVLAVNTLKEYQEGNNLSIGPGTAFFVLVNNPGTDNITFTSRMQVDPMMSNNALAVQQAEASAKRYTLDDVTGIKDIITPSDDVRPMRCWSPAAGWVTVEAGTKPLARISVYGVDGTLMTSVKPEGSETRLQVGHGMRIVQAVAADGTTETIKMMVK